ncbi:MAG: NAD(P)/FAD-dependent oxidoreductase [Betaproteobacteria bacterium]|nr:NAD(P)/FAD-dependent oxidoreductase [Betaproteobacteria bacterium]
MPLSSLAELARRELAQLNYPAPNWVLPKEGPGGEPLLDVLVIGGGMCGQTAAFALLREGVRNLRCVDRAPRGLEGPWATFARMDTLRSPKHLTGPELGVASLTYRAYHEAKFGEESWQKLHKIDRLEWARYLLWVRDVAAVPVENGVEVGSISVFPGYSRIEFKNGPALFSRKTVLALGREGSGALRWPRFATFDPAKRAGMNVFHSADEIDFSRLAGKRLAVLGVGSSAFDNAATALERGAASATLFARRRFLPQVNKSKWTAFPGFLEGYASLEDARRWRFYTYIFSQQVPPPYESVLRCEKHKGFSIRFGVSVLDLSPGEKGVVIRTERQEETFDAVIVCTGFDVNLMDRPEIASFRDSIETWRSHVSHEEARAHPEEARFPHLGDSFQLKGALPGLERIHVFNWGATLSHGALAGDIPGLETGARRLANGIARDLFLEDADRHWERLLVHNEDELKSTGYFVPPQDRR